MQRFKTGEAIPTSGIYRVLHSKHRLPHEVILIGGSQFPRCAKCASAVTFFLIRAARVGFEWHPVKIYELPALDDEAEAEATTA